MPSLLTLLLGLALVGMVGLLLWMQRRHSTCLEQVQTESEAVLAEERRLFSFLHDLGESLNSDGRPLAMHRLIVEGAMQVTDAAGGAIYLLDDSGRKLVPKYYSEHCAPLVRLPERIVAMAKDNPGSLLSFLRLHAVHTEDALIGGVFQQQRAEIVRDLKREQRFGSSSNPLHPSCNAMLSPLTSGSRQLGILAVTQAREGREFNDNDFDVFRAVAEQSAFALANAMVHKEAQAKHQLDSELRAASSVQRILLPESDPQIPGFKIAGHSVPARVLSGDFYDYIDLGGDRLGVIIADVSGKGTGAALISAMCRSMVRIIARQESSPAAVLAAVNRQLFADIREDMFVTMLYAVLDAGSGEVTFARAGHTDPMVWRAQTGEVEEIRCPGMAVGIDAGSVFERVMEDRTLPLGTQDTLLLYTDGVSEALDEKELMFGEERIARTLARLALQSPEQIVDGVQEEVGSFLGGGRSLDDITLIALQKTA